MILKYSNVKDIDDKRDYLHRWSLHLPFGWSLKLHKIVRPDEDRCEHDHPWIFIRFILYGGYTESINGKMILRKPFHVYPCFTSFRHSIRKLTKNENWSLVLCGPHIRPWGFFTSAGWVVWHKFIEKVKKGIVWCDDGDKTEIKGE